MSGKLIDLTEENFDAAIKEGVTLVDFWATWCGPCKMQTPILEKIADAFEDVKIAKVNVDDSQNLASNFGVQSIPTLVLFKDGTQIQKIVGLQNESYLTSILQNV